MTSVSGSTRHAEAALVISRLGLAQAGDAAAGRIAVGVGLGRDLGQLVDDVLRRRAVGIAHAEVDDVLAARPRRGLHRVDLGEDVGRQAPDAVEFVGHRGVMAAMLQCGKPSRDRRAATSRARSPVRAARSRRRPRSGPRSARDRPSKRQPDEQAGGQRGGGHVELGPHQDRRLAGEHVADDPAGAGGQHAHGEGGNRRDAIAQRLGRAVGRVGGEAGGVEPEQGRAGDERRLLASQTSSAAPMQISKVALVCTQKTGRRSAGRAACRRRPR